MITDSRTPSTMSSSSRSSKRGHDEVEVDEDEEESCPHSSPGMLHAASHSTLLGSDNSVADVKKARIQ